MKKKVLSKSRFSVLFWIFWSISRFLPLSAASALLSSMMRVFADQLTRQHVIRENLSKAFPEMSPATVKKTAKQIAANLGVLAAELSHIDEFQGGIASGKLTYTGDSQLALAKAGPVLFVGAHQWNWEVAPIFYTESGVKVTIIYAKLANELIDRTILAARQKTGAIYVEKRSAVRTAINALESGGSLAFLMDQRVKSGVKVNFLGRDSLMTSFPARLAIRFRCPIVPIEMERLGSHRFHMTLCTPIYPASNTGDEAEQQLTQAIANQLERAIRRSPETWFCNTRRWRDS
jgi:Kdo2-lipid IVA lauroyltransferase/acyltransferase